MRSFELENRRYVIGGAAVLIIIVYIIIPVLVCAKVIFDAYFRCNDVRRFGSCAMELCYLAAGQCDLFFEYRVQAWDYSAAYLILTEAGGVLTGGRGENLSCDTPTMLVGANNGANHAQLLEIVSKYI